MGHYLHGIDAIGGGMPSWAKDVWGGLHLAGGAVLSALGMHSVALSLEKLEVSANMLPSWALSSTPTPKGDPSAVVTSPDYVILVASDGSNSVSDKVDSVVIYGTTRFDGNGYRQGDAVGKTFSFGYDAPTQIVVVKNSQKAPATVKRVLFCGGTESTASSTTPATVSGYTADDNDRELARMSSAGGYPEIVGGAHDASSTTWPTYVAYVVTGARARRRRRSALPARLEMSADFDFNRLIFGLRHEARERQIAAGVDALVGADATTPVNAKPKSTGTNWAAALESGAGTLLTDLSAKPAPPAPGAADKHAKKPASSSSWPTTLAIVLGGLTVSVIAYLSLKYFSS